MNFFRSEMANFSEIEHMVQEYYEVASTDWVLLEKYVDSDGARSHRAIGNDERIRCSSKSALHKYMDELYQVSLNFVSYEKDLRFSEDSSRGYCGYKVVAKKNFQVGEIIPGLHGVLASCPENINFKLNFSVVNINKVSYSLQGPLSFVNHSCRSNCKYKQKKRCGFSISMQSY